MTTSPSRESRLRHHNINANKVINYKNYTTGYAVLVENLNLLVPFWLLQELTELQYPSVRHFGIKRDNRDRDNK